VRSSGRGCRAAHSPPTRFGSSFMLAYNLSNFLRRLATPEPIKDWSLTSLKERLIKISAKVRGPSVGRLGLVWGFSSCP
jgi:hypothetical protein